MTTKVSPLSVQPDSTNPLQPTSFRFSLNKTPEAVYFCQSANLPGLTKAAVTQSNVFSDIKQPGDRIEFDELTITFIVNEDLGNWIELKNWITSLAPYDSVSEENTGRKVIDDVEDASLLIMHSNLNERIRVSFRGAFATSLSGIDFTSSVSDMETITATVTFAYTDYDVEVL